MKLFLLKFASLSFVCLLASMLVMSGVGRALAYNVIAYTSTDIEDYLDKSLRLYDLHHRLSATLVPRVDLYDFSFSIDGRLAFPRIENRRGEIYVLDTLAPSLPPVHITHQTTTNDSPLGWSPDGRYLAFKSYVRVQDALIYVWDGEEAVDITPHDMTNPVIEYYPAWSADGRLAFSVRYGVVPAPVPSEIYLWDGHSTTSLSQSPKAWDSAPVWSASGRLAFASQDNEYEIFVWDGRSVENGAPDSSTFTRVAPDLIKTYSGYAWTTDEQLAFVTQMPSDDSVQVYVWDGRSATNMSQNPIQHNGSPRWSRDGRWAFVTFLSRQQLLYVRDADNQSLLTVEGQYPPAWGAEGQLLFCARQGSGYVLSWWDGGHPIPIAQGYSIYAQWPGGEGVVCANG